VRPFLPQLNFIVRLRLCRISLWDEALKIELAEGVGFVPKITIFWNNHNRFRLVFKRILSLFVNIRSLRFLTILLTLLLTVLEGVGVHTLSSR
jgi:hypothetical protein